MRGPPRFDESVQVEPGRQLNQVPYVPLDRWYSRAADDARVCQSPRTPKVSDEPPGTMSSSVVGSL